MLAAEIIKELAPKGVLRAGLNTGNTVLMQRDSAGALGGIAIDLANEFARHAGLPLELVTFTSAKNLFSALKDGAWDIAFMAVEPERATEIDFSMPYIATEGAYMVRDSSPLNTPADVDAEGVRVSVGMASAYDLFLTRTLKHAELVRAPEGGSRAMIDLLIAQNLHATAGVRAWLDGYVADHAGFRVMSQPFMEIGQAIGVPKGKARALAALQEFVATMKASGFVANSLERSGQTAKVP